MLMENGALDRWLDRAASRIRFRPDREAVRRELRGHIEDKMSDLRRLFPDMSEREARDRALDGMGDVDELSKSLARVHRPWLGYLWYACRGLLVLSALAWLLLAGLPALMEGEDGWSVRRAEIWYDGVQPEEWSPPEEVQVGDMTVAVTRAARLTEDFYDGGGGGQLRFSCESAALTLRVTARYPWERPSGLNKGLENNLRGVDSGGRAFSFASDPEAEWFDTQPLQGGRAGLCWRQYELYFRDITPGAEWVELRYSFGGRAFTLRANIPEESHFHHGGIWEEEGTA